MEVRFRGFVTTIEVMLTAGLGQYAKLSQIWSGMARTAILVSEIQSRPIVGSATDIAHGDGSSAEASSGSWGMAVLRGERAGKGKMARGSRREADRHLEARSDQTGRKKCSDK